MKSLLLISIGISFFTNLLAQSEGPKNGRSFSQISIAGSNRSWNISDNLEQSDNLYTDFGNINSGAGAYTNYLIATDFGFSLPSGVIITGIMAEVERSDPNNKTADYSIRIVRGGILGTAERSTGTSYPVSDAYAAYGSPSDLWGQSWTNTDINNSNFGIAISAQRTSSGGTTGGRIDHIRITVYYTTNAFTLPVRLVSFTTAKTARSVNTQWITAEETAMDRYEIQRSSDGFAFATIGSVNSENTSQLNNYSFEDNSPVKGVNYYRLKMIGQNPTDNKLSAVSITRFDGKNNAVIYPTVINANQVFHFDNPARETLYIDFYNPNGQKIATISGTGEKFSSGKLTGHQGLLNYRIFNDKKELKGKGSVIIQ